MTVDTVQRVSKMAEKVQSGLLLEGHGNKNELMIFIDSIIS